MYVRIKLMASKYERMMQIGNGNRPHGKLRKHMIQIGEMKEPRDNWQEITIRWDFEKKRKK